MKNLVDFHCHLDLYPNFQSVIKATEESEIRTIAVTTTPKAWPKNRELTQGMRFVRPALGLHPQLIKSDATEELSIWEQYLPEARYVGEVGIDGGPDFKHTIEEQKRVFEHILKLCSEAGGKILTVHSARSASIVLNLIENCLPKGRGAVVLHWFTGNDNEAKRAVELGCYFSVNTNMLLSNKGQGLIKKLPLDRILTETDGPFIEFENKPVTPKDAENVTRLLANLLQKDSQEIIDIVFSNLRNLLKI